MKSFDPNDVPRIPSGPSVTDLIPGVGAFIRGVKFLDSLPNPDSRIQAANRAAARAAGFTGTNAELEQIGGGLRNRADFTAQTADRERAAQNAQIARITQTLPATIPGQTGTFNPPDVYRPPPAGPTPQPPPYRPSPLPGGTPPINPTGGVGPIVPVFDVGSAISRIWDLNTWLTTGMNRAIFGPRPIPKGPTTRPPVGRRPPFVEETYANREMGNPFPPQGSPPQRAERVPRAERVRARLDELGGDIYVNQRRLPMPAAVPATPVKTPLWLQLLGFAGPALLGALMPGQGNRTVLRLTDPLTQPRTDGNPFPLTGVQTAVQSFGAFGGSGGAVGTNTCECKPPRKKGRRKKRTVCYSGTFIERADGTRKTKKRKVQC